MSMQEYDKTWLLVSKPKLTTPASTVPQIAVEDADAPDSSPPDGDEGTGVRAPSNFGETNVVSHTGDEPGISDDAEGNDDVRDGNVDNGTIVKIMDITQMKTRAGQSVVTKTRRFKKPKDKKDRFRDYAGILRRTLNEKGKAISVNLDWSLE
ncbi:hypothetical protein TI39_contig5830g00011 [Zymoseptoria brevis]|uniref:Uncharacterized protein n=1 Tax=Zymoseptoria brevis TaxID=1047168 RepID=A0A0F4G8Z6_9PEZI|nr:hypothetical protein TI39_contig5830g00011 [Zymoseptoria brevis]